MDKFFLVKSEFNWSDEIDFEGFDLFTDEELASARARYSRLAANDAILTCSVGANEELEVEASEVLEDLDDADEISREAYVILMNKMGDHYGKTLYNLYEESE